MQPIDQKIEVGDIHLHIRDWQPDSLKPDLPVFVLLHGLASNARTWDFIAQRLNNAGYRAIAIDQRGHGLSDKPQQGYDFSTIVGDLMNLVGNLGLVTPILVGQSWGGNVVLEAAARYPDIVSKAIFVDGGYLDLASRGSWEEVSRELRPPNLLGYPMESLAKRIGQSHPTWVPEGVEMTLGNFEYLPDGTLRPWLTLEAHMLILQAMYHQNVMSIFPQVTSPVLICPADDGSDWARRKRVQVEAAASLLPDVEVVWLKGAHDLHIDSPDELVTVILDFIT